MLVPTIGNNAIVIEIKTGKKPLVEKDIDQVKRYASDKKQRFAILSNGYEYVLLDFDIKSTPVIEGDTVNQSTQANNTPNTSAEWELLLKIERKQLETLEDIKSMIKFFFVLTIIGLVLSIAIPFL